MPTPHLPREAEPCVWVLDMSHTGDTNIRLAIGHALSPHNTHLIKAEQFRSDLTAALQHNPPDIFIGCEQSPMFGKAMRDALGDKAFIIGMQAADFDSNHFEKDPSNPLGIHMSLLYRHHASAQPNPMVERITPNIVRSRHDFVPSPMTSTLLDEARGETFQNLKHPLFMLSIGSVTQKGGAAEREANVRAMVKQVATAARQQGGSVLVSTSRRTPAEMVQWIGQEMGDTPHYLHDWEKAAAGRNPYLSMLAAADKVIISGDSIAMTMDSLATGKPTYVFAPGGPPMEGLCHAFTDCTLLKPEVCRYMAMLASRGMIHPLDDLGKEIASREPFNATQEFACAIKEAYAKHVRHQQGWAR